MQYHTIPSSLLIFASQQGISQAVISWRFQFALLPWPRPTPVVLYCIVLDDLK